MAEATASPELTEDRLLDGRVRLLQPRRGHRAGTDAVLLATAADIRPGDHLLDLGSASGAVGLVAAARVPGIRLTLVERDPALAALAAENIRLNGLCGRGEARVADLFHDRPLLRRSGLTAGMGDVVVTNPPFFEGRAARASPDPARRAAHELDGGDLAGWLAAARWLLRPAGRLCLIHRADALGLCLSALGAGYGSIRVTPVYGGAGRPAVRIVVAAVKDGRGPLRIDRPVDLAAAAAAAARPD